MPPPQSQTPRSVGCYAWVSVAARYHAAVEKTFYQPGSRRAERVEDLFATVAPRYDLINDLQSFGMHRLWKRLLVKECMVTQGQPVLDLCCGTGDVSFLMAAAGACVIGCDVSEPMLAVARQRRKEESIQFIQCDALNIPVPDASFDLVTLSYGLRNLADFDAGLREIWRVLRPGGRVLILDFGKPPQPLLRAIYFGYLRKVIPLFGRLFCGNEATHAYIYESLLNYPAQEGVEAALRNLGADWSEITYILGGVMTINHARKPWAITP